MSDSPDLASVVAAGDLRASLEALRDHLARRLVDAEIREAAAIARQLADTLKALAVLPVAKERSTADDLANRRAARRAKASAGATRKGVERSSRGS